MAGFVLVVGYDYDEFRELQEAGSANGIVCDHAASPAELVCLAQAKPPKAGKTHAAPEEKAAPPAPEVPPAPRDATRGEKEEAISTATICNGSQGISWQLIRSDLPHNPAGTLTEKTVVL